MDPTGNYVLWTLNDYYQQTYDAWHLFKDTYPEIAGMMEESDISFYITMDSIGKNYIGTAQQDKDNPNHVNITIDKDNVPKDVKAIAWAISHETVHCVGFIIDPIGGGGKSKFEDAIAFQFQFSFGRQIGYTPFWYDDPYSPYSAYQISTWAMKVDFTQELGSISMSNQLTEAFKGTDYKGYKDYPMVGPIAGEIKI